MKFNIKVEPMELPRNWKLVEECIYGDILIPQGFEFDGASIPFGFRWLFKHGGAKFPGACVHDYLYRTGKLAKADADSLFLKIMLENGVSPLRAKLMYLAVKYFGFIAWKARRKQDE